MTRQVSGSSILNARKQLTAADREFRPRHDVSWALISFLRDGSKRAGKSALNPASKIPTNLAQRLLGRFVL